MVEYILQFLCLNLELILSASLSRFCSTDPPRVRTPNKTFHVRVLSLNYSQACKNMKPCVEAAQAHRCTKSIITQKS